MAIKNKLTGRNSPVGIKFTVDKAALKNLQRRLKDFPKNKITAAEATAIKVSLRTIKSKSATILKSELNVTAKTVKSKISSFMRRRKRGKGTQVTGIMQTLGSPQEQHRGGKIREQRKIKAGRIALSKFIGTREIGGRRKTTKPGDPTPPYGVSYKLGKNFPRQKIIENAKSLPSPPFMLSMPSGHKGVFRRLTASGREQELTNLVQLYGVSLTYAALRSTKWNQYIMRETPNILLKNFDRQLTFQLHKLNQQLNR